MMMTVNMNKAKEKTLLQNNLTYSFRFDYKMDFQKMHLPIQPWFHVYQHRCHQPTALSTNNHNLSAYLLNFDFNFYFIRFKYWQNMVRLLLFFLRNDKWEKKNKKFISTVEYWSYYELKLIYLPICVHINPESRSNEFMNKKISF